MFKIASLTKVCARYQTPFGNAIATETLFQTFATVTVSGDLPGL